MRMLKEEFGDALQLEWRSFLLRPEPSDRSLDDFRRYTRSWLRVASDEPSGEFRVWSTDNGPPSHSVPPHLVAKAAASLGEDAFARVHEALLTAYFTDNRDITDGATLRAIWDECGLPEAEFERIRTPEFAQRIIEEHNEAIECGATGVPAFRTADNDTAVTGAHPIELYRRWFNRILGREG